MSTRDAFTYESLPMRVRFGRGAVAELGRELDELAVERVLVLSTPQQVDLAHAVAKAIEHRAVGVHAEARMHVPVETAEAAASEARRLGADACVAVGGGSTIGLGKAIALEHGLPIIAIPTTFAGSEMTPVWGLTRNGVKETGRDPKVLPRSVIYDPELVLSLPVAMCVTSGFNAIAHAVEALYAPDTSPIIELMAADGARALLSGLPRIVDDPDDVAARGEALRGAWLCGATLGATTMGLHHKLCHSLGGTLNLPHAETHTVVLPYVAAFNLASAHRANERLRETLGVEAPATHLQVTAQRLGAPASLAELGFAETDIDRIARLVLGKPYANPREVTERDVREILRAAWQGSPAADVAAATTT